MDSDEDDIYPTQEPAETKMAVDDGEEEGEELEEDSDDEVNFITDSKEEPKEIKKDFSLKPQTQASRTASDSQRRSSTPQPQPKRGPSQEIKTEVRTPPIDDRPGTEYPARHTSKLDPNGNPIHPATGKPILSTDFDVDFPTESSKAWRKPGADITDYFNYGFDEFTWASYCLKQQQMPKEVKEINQQAEQMKGFLEGIPGGGMPGMPGVPTGPAAGGGGQGTMGMPGMPSEAEMQTMFQNMMNSGVDMSQMDQNQFMQMMMGGGGNMMGSNQPPTGPGGGGFGGGGGFDQGGGFGGGRGRGRRGRGNW